MPAIVSDSLCRLPKAGHSGSPAFPPARRPREPSRPQDMSEPGLGLTGRNRRRIPLPPSSGAIRCNGSSIDILQEFAAHTDRAAARAATTRFVITAHLEIADDLALHPRNQSRESKLGDI